LVYFVHTTYDKESFIEECLCLRFHFPLQRGTLVYVTEMENRDYVIRNESKKSDRIETVLFCSTFYAIYIQYLKSRIGEDQVTRCSVAC
jgi:hypothetical protein